MLVSRGWLVACAVIGLLALGAAVPARGAKVAFPVPAWLRLEPGASARIAQAPWPASASEAALTGSEETAKTDPDDFSDRPADVVHAPAGIAVTVEELFDDHVALVKTGAATEAYTRVEFLLPNVPAGTELVVGGGFGRYTYFYSALETPTDHAIELPDGTPLVALKEATAPPDLGSDDLIRIKVLVTGGKYRGRVGWVPVNYTGLPLGRATPENTAEGDCRCRLLEFR